MRSKSYVCLLIFILVLLGFANLVRSDIIVDRSFLPRVFSLTVILLITWIAGFRKMIHTDLNLFITAFFLFYLWNLLSSLWAISPSEALFQSQLVFLSLMVFMVVFNLDSENRVVEPLFIKIQLVVLLFSFGLAFYKMSLLAFYDPYQMNSVCGNNNLYSGFLIISLPLVISGYSLFQGFWKYVAVGTGILTLFFIIIVQSRAGYLGLVAGLLFSVIFLLVRYRYLLTKLNGVTLSLAVLLLFGSVAGFYFSLDHTRRNYFLSKIPVWQYLVSYQEIADEDIWRFGTNRQADLNHIPAFDYAVDYYENANLRIIFWKRSFCLIRTKPLVGVGAGNWKLAVTSCKNPVNPEHTLKNFTYSQPHNEWIGILSELGIIGMGIALFIFIIPLLIICYHLLFREPKPPVQAVFYTSFIVGFYLYAFFDFPFKRVEHNVVFFTVLAFLFRKVPREPVRLKWKKRYPRLIFGFIILLLLLFTGFLAVMRLRGEYYTLLMFTNERKNDTKVIRYSRLAETRCYQITPNNLPIAWFEGVSHYRNGNMDSALYCFTRAILITPSEVRVLNDYGITLFNLNRTKEAKSVLYRSLEIDPYFDDAKFNLASIFFLTGQTDSAEFFVQDCRNGIRKEEFLTEISRFRKAEATRNHSGYVPGF